MKIKSILLFVISFFAVTSVSAQNWKYVDATDLTIVGKLFPDHFSNN